MDDTQAVVMGATSLEGKFPTTEEWLQVTGQDVRLHKAYSWTNGQQGTPAFLLRVSPSR